ncbi:hypothetical protein ACJMK2_010019, partial [Sinanodonta woodiana]
PTLDILQEATNVSDTDINNGKMMATTKKSVLLPSQCSCLGKCVEYRYPAHAMLSIIENKSFRVDENQSISQLNKPFLNIKVYDE